MSPLPISKYQDGKLWTLSGGSYVEDVRGWHSISLLSSLKSLPEEYRTQQDKQFINDLQEAFRARREAEGEG